MSSKPAMMRSSRGVRLEALGAGISTPSAASNSSSSISAIAGFFVHRFRQHRIGGIEWIDAVNQVNIQVAHVDELAHPIQQRRAALRAAVGIGLGQYQLCLLRYVHSRDRIFLNFP